jgi:sulfite exporter TauE/SafE
VSATASTAILSGVAPLAASVLVASVVGSPHCAGMCGGLVAFCTGIGEGRRSRSALVGYHGARLLSYAIVGVAAGAVGLALDLGGAMAGVQRIAAIAAGVTICLFGVATLLRLGGVRLACVPAPPWAVSVLKRIHVGAANRSPAVRGTIVGLASPLLPCGWLWAFAAIAAGTASPLAGGAVMAAFWLGTVPILTALGAGLAWVPAHARRSLAALAAVAMIAVGLQTAVVRSASADAVVADMVRRLHRVGVESDGATDFDAAAAVERLAEEDELPACCRSRGES